MVFSSASGNRDSVIIRGGGTQSVFVTENLFRVAGNNDTTADLILKQAGEGHPPGIYFIKATDKESNYGFKKIIVCDI